MPTLRGIGWFLGLGRWLARKRTPRRRVVGPATWLCGFAEVNARNNVTHLLAMDEFRTSVAVAHLERHRPVWGALL